MDKPEFASILDKICIFICDMLDHNRILQGDSNPLNTPLTRDAILDKVEPLKSRFQKGLRNCDG